MQLQYKVPILGLGRINKSRPLLDNLAEFASETLPFWDSFPGSVGLVMRTGSQCRPPGFRTSMMIQAGGCSLHRPTCAAGTFVSLTSVSQAGSQAAAAFADEVLQVSCDSRYRYREFALLSGLDTALPISGVPISSAALRVARFVAVLEIAGIPGRRRRVRPLMSCR
jgi:hypothetical protein